MGPIWGRQDAGGPHVGPMNFVIWEQSGNARAFFGICRVLPPYIRQWALLCVIAELQLYFMISLHNINMFNPCTTHKWHDEEPIPRVWRLTCGKSERVKIKSAGERTTCFLKQLQSFQRGNYKRVRCVQWSLRLIYNKVHYMHTQWDTSPETTAGANILVPCHVARSLKCIWGSETMDQI